MLAPEGGIRGHDKHVVKDFVGEISEPLSQKRFEQFEKQQRVKLVK